MYMLSNQRRLAVLASSDMEKTRTCLLCGSESRNRFVLVHTRVRQCTNPGCGLQFADPQLSDQDLECAYTELYYPPDGREHRIRFENTPERTLEQVFAGLAGRLGGVRGLRLLDYGCGRGTLLSVAESEGMSVEGVEPDPVARGIAGQRFGGRIYASIEELLKGRRSVRFDLISLWTVIEHLREPWVDLAQLRELLQPGGWLLISTMDVRCLRARVEGQKWENYANPTHFYYFDRCSLERAIRKGGFESCAVWRLRVRHQGHGLARALLYRVSFALGIADGLYFLCRKETKEVTDTWGNARSNEDLVGGRLDLEEELREEAGP